MITNKIQKRLCTLLLAVMLGYSSAYSQKIVATETAYHLPVLIGKNFNPVSKLKIISKAGKINKLQRVNIMLSPESANEILEITVFQSGEDSSFTSDVKLQKAGVFATTKQVKGKVVTLDGNYQLGDGNNYFWLSVKLKPTAALSKHVKLLVPSVVLDGKKTSVELTTKNPDRRIGIAVRQHKQDNVHTHRIPGLATANDGTLLAVYDARWAKGQDLQGDIDIGVSRSLDKGKTWLPMQVAMDMGEWGGLPQKFNGISDACILVDKKTGTIYLAGLWMYGVLDKNGKWIENLNEQSTDWNHQWREGGSQPGFDVKQTSQFLIVKSIDNGKNWSKPVNLTKMCKKEEWWLWAPAPGGGITLENGTLVFPTQGRDANGEAFSNITYSKDGGNTWETSNPAIKESTTENMAVELADGSVMLNMRANSNKNDSSSNNGRAVATTKDLGKTWKTHPTSHKALQEPTCMASIIKHVYVQNGKKKSVLVFCNPDSKTARVNLSLKISYDDGNTWPKTILLDEARSRGYSCLTSVDNNTIGVLFESSQADLVFQQFNINELL